MNKSFLLANSTSYEWLVRKIQAMNPQKEQETVLSSVQKAAWFAGYYHTGRFADGAIENVAFNIGIDLDAHSPELESFKLPSIRMSGRRRILHVTPGLSMGGHRQLLYQWIYNDRTSCHSLALIDQVGEIPKQYYEIIQNSGGSLVALPPSNCYEKAQLLRALARNTADLIVWHLIGPDVISMVAFATHECPPVVLIDHCDHLFWLGSSVADLVVNLRTLGAELTAERRFASCIEVIPIPLLESKNNMSRGDARRILGIKEDQIMLLSIGRAEKYRPYGVYDFVMTANKLLDRQQDAHLYVVGESTVGITPFLNCALHDRLHFMGSIDDPSIYRSAADIYLESFPFGSQTALLEAALSGLPVVPAYAPLFPMLVANDDALTDILPNTKNELEYIKRVEALIREPEQRAAFGDTLRKRLLVDHVGNGWLDRLTTLYQTTDLLTHNPKLIPTSTCTMTDMDISLSQWHVEARKPNSPSISNDDVGTVLCHTAFVSKAVGDFATALRYAWCAVKHDPYRFLAWRLLLIALMGRTGKLINRGFGITGQLVQHFQRWHELLRLHLYRRG
ncbi:glycosyltransferase [Methyloglobulus sp.]|uniref:glycosyltransferase n=1 Tax=Methyloglobulus sp. TaxID=2518622 RepID=UPI0032B764FA